MSDVFLSHSSKDKPIADKVCQFLEEKGLSCWIAPRNIVPGSDWAASISTAITASKVFLLIYSENSAASSQVGRELSLAESKDDVFVVPYKVDETELSGSFEYYLTGAHWISANYAKKDYKLEELYNLVLGIIGRNIQNITNNTYIDNLHIHTDNPENLQDVQGMAQAAVSAMTAGGAMPYAPSAPVVKADNKKRNIIIGVSAGAVALIAIIVCISVFGGKDNDKVQTANSKPESSITAVESTTGTTGEGKTETLSDIKVNYGNDTYTGTYSGEVNGDIPEDEGEFTGTFTSDSGEWKMTAKGEFSDGKLNGQNTVNIDNPNGYKFVIEVSFDNGFENGVGTREQIYPDGKKIIKDVYEGNFNNGKLTDDKGTRTYYYSDENDKDIQVREGQFQNGMLSGTGKVTNTYKSGNLKTAVTESDNWEEDLIQGNGKVTVYYTNGDIKVYEGEYKDDKWNGSATLTYTYADGTYYYQEGTAVNDSFTPSITINYDKDGNELSREES